MLSESFCRCSRTRVCENHASSSCALLLLLLAACNSDPKAAGKRYVANGNRYFARGQYKEASILYRRALAKDLRSPDAWYRLRAW